MERPYLFTVRGLEVAPAYNGGTSSSKSNFTVNIMSAEGPQERSDPMTKVARSRLWALLEGILGPQIARNVDPLQASLGDKALLLIAVFGVVDFHGCP